MLDGPRSLRPASAHPFSRALILAIVALAALWLPAMARAVPLKIGGSLCHATKSAALPIDAPPPRAYSCTGEPRDYQDRALWLHAETAALGLPPRGVSLMLHHTRFDRMTVFFTYADGRVVRQGVTRGDYGTFWRIGGHLRFDAPLRDAALTDVTMRFDHLASHTLVRGRIVPTAPIGTELALVAGLVGGALTLLLAGAIYNLCLSIAARRQFLLWHSLWATTVFVWGTLWSQFALWVVPGVAGTTAAQTSTFLAVLAIALATMSGATAIRRGVLPRWLHIGLFALAGANALLGLSVAFTNAPISVVGLLLEVFSLADIAAVVLAIVIGWRRGSQEARDLAYAWAVPMAVLTFTMFFDFRDSLFGGGSQIMVLFASALQTVWLSIGQTRRLARLRVERDAARAAELELSELAARDPLTGLLNRRGFLARAEAMWATADPARGHIALLLIDADEFKAINDRFGHETGDTVLVTLARCLSGMEDARTIVGRLGGEEFMIGVAERDAPAIRALAERARALLGACDHGPVTARRPVTVSIGVAEGHRATGFQKLYGMADRALYDAKRLGRNRVMIFGQANAQAEIEFARDQLAFDFAG
ncbi:diguanylate cyclase [Sphingomonas naphthae]|uniref:diguanylate cyclase n=1 Tax=Sphingomonas naphthae TaxID=1813468 RepID=A0ABY7TMK9_9SPHN|nr:diguanylate cyclase [Sphingomonas naphthae]WCT74263.1 diguanylate cyclase [Sphingomonas naphthae]